MPVGQWPAQKVGASSDSRVAAVPSALSCERPLGLCRPHDKQGPSWRVMATGGYRKNPQDSTSSKNMRKRQ